MNKENNIYYRKLIEYYFRFKESFKFLKIKKGLFQKLFKKT